jgi:RNA-splicing ligase RtcB
VNRGLPENENVWVLLRSGSRGVGDRFGTFFHRAGEE